MNLGFALEDNFRSRRLRGRNPTAKEAKLHTLTSLLYLFTKEISWGSVLSSQGAGELLVRIKAEIELASSMVMLYM